MSKLLSLEGKQDLKVQISESRSMNSLDSNAGGERTWQQDILKTISRSKALESSSGIPRDVSRDIQPEIRGPGDQAPFLGRGKRKGKLISQQSSGSRLSPCLNDQLYWKPVRLLVSKYQPLGHTNAGKEMRRTPSRSQTDTQRLAPKCTRRELLDLNMPPGLILIGSWTDWFSLPVIKTGLHDTALLF